MSAAPSERKPRRLALRLLAAAALFFILAEVSLRLLFARGRVAYDGSAAEYFAALGTHPSDAPTKAEELPPHSAFRIVVAGDSTAIGFPYGESTSFTSLLAGGLTAATGRTCEAVHVGVAGRSSVGVVADLDRVFAAQPDLLLVYVGNNEFAHRIATLSPMGPIRHGVIESILPGLSEAARLVGDLIAQRDATSLGDVPGPFTSALGHACRLLAFGDPERTPSRNLQLTDHEVALHLDRYAMNLRRIAEAARARGVRLAFVEPTSCLTAAPLCSGRNCGSEAQVRWEVAMRRKRATGLLAREALVEARDSDPAPIRLTERMRVRLRESTGGAASIPLETRDIEERFVDLVHPRPVLAADIARTIAAALPFEGIPKLDPKDDAAVERFRLACDRLLAAQTEAIEQGELLGSLLAAHMHLEYGNRSAAEAEVLAFPEPKRNFEMLLVLDLALRFRGARDEANARLDAAAARRADWAPSISWWRARANR